VAALERAGIALESTGMEQTDVYNFFSQAYGPER
jgi:hypothetical protein